MSFGWSAGDIIAGVKILWDVYNSISDGPLNATHEAAQFFHDFELINSCLESWDSRDPHSSGKPTLTESLRQKCADFIHTHMRLIQDANKDTVEWNGGRTWLRKVPFTKPQVLKLYQQVQWPFERGNVAELRRSLELALGVATYRAAEESHEMLKKLSISVEEIWQSQFSRYSIIHEDPHPNHRLADLITRNLNRIINPLEFNGKLDEMDCSLLLQFERELRPRKPFTTNQTPKSFDQESPSSQFKSEEYLESQVVDPFDKSFSRSTTFNENAPLFDEGFLMRLDNLSMRRTQLITNKKPAKENVDSAIQTIIDHLRALRRDVFGSVELDGSLLISGKSTEGYPDFKRALMQELAEWQNIKLDGRTPADRINPGCAQRRASAFQAQSPGMGPQSPRIGPRSPKMGPPTSHGTWPPAIKIPSRLEPMPEEFPLQDLSPHSSPFYHHGYARSSISSMSSLEQRKNSTSPLPLLSLPPLDPQIPVLLDYNKEKSAIQATIKSIPTSKKGITQSIWIFSTDDQALFQHSLDQKSSGQIENSLIPYLENRNVAPQHKYRVQFMGAHKITKIDNYTQPGVPLDMSHPPIYIFGNENDFLCFQKLLLNKAVKCYPHIKRIDAIPKERDPESNNSGTIRVLLDPSNNMRSILYFRTRPDPQEAFVEWSTKIFKKPKKPDPKTSSLTLRSQNDKALQLAQIEWKREQQNSSMMKNNNNLSGGSSRAASISSTSSRGSVDVAPSTCTTTTMARERKQQLKHVEKLLKGLVINFCNSEDCLSFWEEFVA